jgi:hypothetical protein
MAYLIIRANCKTQVLHEFRIKFELKSGFILTPDSIILLDVSLVPPCGNYFCNYLINVLFRRAAYRIELSGQYILYLVLERNPVFKIYR